VNSTPSESAGAVPKFRRRTGADSLHSELYEVKMAAFLFARGLNRTEEFLLASNVEGVGAFDDLVFRYRLRDSDVWKTCFIQLKHKKSKGTIQRSSLTQMSGNFSLFKYFNSYCEIKQNAPTDPKLKECGPFVDFEFIIYTNEKMKYVSLIQGKASDPLSILSSGTDFGKYITFDRTSEKDIFEYFEQLSLYQNFITDLDSVLNTGTYVEKDINLEIKNFQSYVTNTDILGKLNSLQSNLNKDYISRLIKEISKCDFTLFEEFLSRVKIFHSQTNEQSLEGLIEIELQEACKASLSVAKFIYKKFDEGFSKWWKKDGNVEWLSQNSKLWKAVQKHIITEINEKSKPITQEIEGCDIRFNQQHVQKLLDAITQNTVLNIVTNSNTRALQRLKIYQALNTLGYKNSLFMGIKSLMILHKEINNLWPCKWSDVMVVDCDTDGNVAHTVLDNVQQSADRGQVLHIPDGNTVNFFVDILQKYQQKLVLISTRQIASGFQEKLRNIPKYFEDNCNIADFHEKSQKQILERNVNFQGTNVPLLTLVGEDPTDSIKALLDSDVISLLFTNELSVGRELGDHSKYYIPRVLQRHIYLKEDILKMTDRAITFAVSGLQADDLKNYLPDGGKLCEFVYDEKERTHIFKIFSDSSNIGLGAECGNVMPDQKEGTKLKSNYASFNIFRNNNSGFTVNECSKINSFSSVATRSETAVSVAVKNRKTYNEAGENIKPEEVRYIILGNINPVSEVTELKERFSNVQWIHWKDNYFLWMNTNCNIDIIRRYIVNTKYEIYDMKSVLEHNDRTMLLVAEPGMGKSTFLSYMAHEIKKWKPSVWVLRINLNEHTNELENIEFENDCIDRCKMFLWNAAHSLKQEALNVAKELFLQALVQIGKMVIILDGYDEISPYYSRKVKMLIKAIRDKTASNIWISSRFPYRQELEDIVGNFAFTLQPFTKENQIQFLEQYWSEVTEISNRENLRTFADKLLCLCSKNISDKDGEFTGIPLQTMMLGEAFVNEAKEYCCSGKISFPKEFNLLFLFKKFTEKKFDIYFKEKNKMDTSRPAVKRDKKNYADKHMISALQYLFTPKEFNELLGTIPANDLEQTKLFLREDNAQEVGIIINTDTVTGRPKFIHRCFAEYFVAKWLTVNFSKCEEFISNFLFNTTYEVTRNIFDRMLAEGSEIHGSVLNNDIHAPNEIFENNRNLKILDKGGRTALHLAASYNRPYIQQLLSFQGIDINTPDSVLKWTPLK
jgi:hypothetical protein